MMTRVLRLGAFVTLAWLLAGGMSVRAQYSYPPGYGGYGWGGWGGASTVAGSTAAGMGNFAAGAGQYNVETAQARSINAQTAMGVNEYMWESQQRNDQAYYARLSKRRKDINAAADGIRDRILNNPEERDIANGDTLNALLGVITNPKVYAKTLQMATQPMPGRAVRRIPFNYAAGGLTYSLSELLDRSNVPAIFDNPAFAAQRKAMRPIAAELKKEADEEGNVKPETIKKFRAGLDKARTTLESITGSGTDERLSGEKFIKALYGLTRMLDSPSYDVYLAAVEKEKSVPLAHVLVFMHAFNLKFGPAKTPEDREMYSQLYGLLSGVRQQINAPMEDVYAAAHNGPKQDNRPHEFFGGMDYQHFNPPKPGGAPPPPAAQP
jgi:hypothetical protein